MNNRYDYAIYSHDRIADLHWDANNFCEVLPEILKN